MVAHYITIDDEAKKEGKKGTGKKGTPKKGTGNFLIKK